MRRARRHSAASFTAFPFSAKLAFLVFGPVFHPGRKEAVRVANDRPGGKGAWPFVRPYNVILNLAIGGDWGGAKGVDDAALPQRMTIDYVRYWAR